MRKSFSLNPENTKIFSVFLKWVIIFQSLTLPNINTYKWKIKVETCVIWWRQKTLLKYILYLYSVHTHTNDLWYTMIFCIIIVQTIARRQNIHPCTLLLFVTDDFATMCYRPMCRWVDGGTYWMTLAQNREQWRKNGVNFYFIKLYVSQVFQCFNVSYQCR